MGGSTELPLPGKGRDHAARAHRGGHAQLPVAESRPRSRLDSREDAICAPRRPGRRDQPWPRTFARSQFALTDQDQDRVVAAGPGKRGRHESPSARSPSSFPSRRGLQLRVTSAVKKSSVIRRSRLFAQRSRVCAVKREEPFSTACCTTWGVRCSCRLCRSHREAASASSAVRGGGHGRHARVGSSSSPGRTCALARRFFAPYPRQAAADKRGQMMTAPPTSSPSKRSTRAERRRAAAHHGALDVLTSIPRTSQIAGARSRWGHGTAIA